MTILDTENRIRRLIWFGAFALCALTVLTITVAVALARWGVLDRPPNKTVGQPGGKACLVARGDVISRAAWSADGREVAFSRLDTSLWPVLRYFLTGGRKPRSAVRNAPMHLEAVDAAAGVKRRIFHGSMPEMPSVASWSRHGYVYADVAAAFLKPGSDVSTIWAIHAASGVSRQLTTGHRDLAPIASPNGHTIAFTRGELGRRSLFVMPAGRGALARVATDVDHFHPFEWAGDGEIVFLSRPPRAGSDASDAVRGIGIVDIRTRHVRSLLRAERITGFCVVGDEAAYAANLRPGANGEWLGSRFRLVDLRTGRTRSLGAMEGRSAYYLRAGPDHSVLFLSPSLGRRAIRGDVYRMDLGGKLTRLTDFGDVVQLYASPRGAFVAFLRRDQPQRESLWVMQVGG